MWASRWSAAIRILPLLVPEDRVGGAVAGAVQRPRRVRSRKRQRARRPRAAASPSTCEPQPRKLRETLRSAAVTSSGMPLRSISSTAKSSSASASSSKLASRSAATPSAATSAPECSTTISTRPRWSMCWWVTIDQLEVVDRVAALGQLALQLVERLARVGPGVDQGQRLVLDQVAVDPPDRERGGDAQAVDAGQRRLLERLLGRQASRPDQPEHLVALAPPCPRARPATRG